jgi:hypothetical protein
LQGVFTGQAFFFLHPQSAFARLHLLHCGFAQSDEPVTTGKASFCVHGQAAIALFKEHVAIPTAIAAAAVSFLIDIFTSLCCSSFCFDKQKPLKNKLIEDYLYLSELKH